MASILINNDFLVNGKLTYEKSLVETIDDQGNKEQYFEVYGVLLTHLYFEDIKTIKTSRFKFDNVAVYKEQGGSDDYNIAYFFKCDDVEILGEDYKGARYILYPEEMKKIEEIMYKDDHPILGGIGSEYKEIIKEEEEDINE